MPKTTITFTIDTDHLGNFTDTHLAQLWHIGQANPAHLSDPDAGDLAEAIGREIIRRWLMSPSAGPELYTHQGNHHYWHALHSLGATVKDGVWSLPTSNNTPEAAA